MASIPGEKKTQHGLKNGHLFLSLLFLKLVE